MTYEQDVVLVEEYNNWVAEKKIKSLDVTPGTFMQERALKFAFDRLAQAVELLKTHEFTHDLSNIERQVLHILEGTEK